MMKAKGGVSPKKYTSVIKMSKESMSKGSWILY